MDILTKQHLESLMGKILLVEWKDDFGETFTRNLSLDSYVCVDGQVQKESGYESVELILSVSFRSRTKNELYNIPVERIVKITVV